MRGALRNATPLRAAREPEVAGGPAGGLQVVDEVEATQRLAQPPKGAQIPPWGAPVDHHLVEPGAQPAEARERCCRQQRDLGIRMMRADRREGSEGQHEIAQRAEADDQYPFHPVLIAASARAWHRRACPAF